MFYLAVNYGTYEGWRLTEYPTAQEALKAVYSGQTFGNEWKILKEMKVEIADDEKPGLVV